MYPMPPVYGAPAGNGGFGFGQPVGIPPWVQEARQHAPAMGNGHQEQLLLALLQMLKGHLPFKTTAAGPAPAGFVPHFHQEPPLQGYLPPTYHPAPGILHR